MVRQDIWENIDDRTDKTREYKYKYTKSSKLHVIRTDDQSKREQVASL